MIVFRKLLTQTEIKNALSNFLVCFPKLIDRVNNLDDYSLKLFNHGSVFVACDNCSVIGLVAYYANDFLSFTGYISLIGIMPSYRRKGYGTELLDFSVEKMKNVGMNKVLLEVDKDNIGAIEYYKKYGLVISGKAREQSYYMIMNIG